MPLQRSGQEIHGFLGVNLRQERLSLADEELAKAINADLHTQVGAIVLRLGRSKQFSTALTETVVRRLAKINGYRYRVAGQRVYRTETEILSGLSVNLITTLVPFRPLNDTTTWAFIADDALMRKDDGSSTPKWGIDAPTATPTVGTTGTGLTGDYKVKFTYVRKVGSNVAHESNPSPASATQTLANQNLSLSGLTASTDSQVTHKRIYRTVAGGTDYLYDQEITNATTTATSTAADTALGAKLEDDNNVPPTASFVTEWQQSIWFCRDTSNASYLWYSKRFRPESVPSANFLDIGTPDDALACAVPLVGLLGVFTMRTKYRVLGSHTAGFTFDEAISHRGTPAPLAAHATERGIAFVAHDGIFLTNLIAPDEELSAHIAPLFFGETVNGLSPVNFDVASTFAGASFRGRLYFSLATGANTTPDTLAVYSPQTKHWYLYDHPCRALYVEEGSDDALTAGLTDGFVYVLEDGTTDAGADIALDVETKDYSGASRETRKLMLWARVDADTLGQALSVEMYVDGVLVRTASLTSSRSKPLVPFPEASMGYSWRLRLRYTGRSRVRIYGVGCVFLPLEAA